MIRDYIDHELERALRQIEELGRQEQIVNNSRGPEGRERRNEAERRAKRIRENLLKNLPSAVIYKFLDATDAASADNFRTAWQEGNRRVDDYLREVIRSWKEGRAYYNDIFEYPRIDLAKLPAYSFVIQFAFKLAQSYISRDEQDFYIIDNPVRKDKIFGLPYVAAPSWKGSLRAALWKLGQRAEDERIVHLFGHEKEAEDQESFRAGRLYFYPTFFTAKGLEIINPQDRQTRTGSIPIPFESVPEGTSGVFTLLYVPFDLIGEDERRTKTEVAGDLHLVATGLQAMLRTYGFGAKTSSGFGLAGEGTRGTLAIRAEYAPGSFETCTQLTKLTEEITQRLQKS